MFDYLDACTWQEKIAISDELKELYNKVLKNENDAFTARQRNEISGAAYDGKIYALGILQATFEILHIPYDAGLQF